MSEKNLPGNKEKCFFLTSPFIEPPAFLRAGKIIRSLGHPPATHNQPDILLTPHRQNSKYSQYKEAWHLLMPEL